MKRTDRGKGRNRGTNKKRGHSSRHDSKFKSSDLPEDDSSNVVQMSQLQIESSEDSNHSNSPNLPSILVHSLFLLH